MLGRSLQKWLRAVVAWAKCLQHNLLALWCAARSPRTPFLAKALAAVVVTYALSPIDLIPDFIPVLGYLDDLLLVPLGIALVIKHIPPRLFTEFQGQAQQRTLPVIGWRGAALVASVWLALGLGLGWLMWPSF